MKNISNRSLLFSLFTLILMSATIISCDTVVFIADNDDDGNNELYVSRINGARVLMLSTGGDVLDFKISPDGSRVAYRADQDTPGVVELYVNSINGGKPVKVTPDLAPDGDVEVLFSLNYDAFNWSPDSNLIAYIADQEKDDFYELFVSTPDGSSNFKVSGEMQAYLDGGDVLEFEWSPDSSLIAYRADQDFNGVIELYANQPSETYTPIKINSPLPDGGPRDVAAEPGSDADVFEWAPDSSWIAYIADQDTNDVFELFTAERITSVPPVFSFSVKVSGTLVSGGGVKEFQWAPDSSRVAYRADQDIYNVVELYTATPDGSHNDKVSITPVMYGNVVGFQWAPDSTLIAYRADQDTNDVLELYTSPPYGSEVPVKVSFIEPFVVGGSVGAFEWAPDSSRVAYLAVQDTDNVTELYTSSPDGRNNAQVSFEPLVTGGNVSEFKWAPNGSRIAYRADQDTDAVDELYSSVPDGSVNDKVSGPLTTDGDGGDVLEFKWAPNSYRVAYRADQDIDNVDELYSSLPDGSENRNISEKLVTNGNVSYFEYAP
ncbi:MAG: PD40 domain-containing protein [Deltaproteobacteria bacterium]|nr:MAG: PD40 domain-containing protein [Deltaproteobacteria bacterium]